jgi:hypothetical protein
MQLVFPIFSISTLRNLQMKKDWRKKPYMVEPQCHVVFPLLPVTCRKFDTAAPGTFI